MVPTFNYSNHFTPMDDQRIEILGRIQRLNQQGDVGSTNTIQDLKQEYNRIVERVYRDSPAEFWDVIEVFPPEIWIRIIQESLPDQNYPFALLLLTMVSTKWQHAIISTPILWAHIQISGLDEDSFATIRTFAHLSRETSLRLTICMPFYYEEDVVDSLLANLLTRLHRVVILADERIIDDMDQERRYFNVKVHEERTVLSGPSQYASRNMGTNAEHSFGHIQHEVTGVESSIILRSPRITGIRNWGLVLGDYPSSRGIQRFEGVKAFNRPEEAFEWMLLHTFEIPLLSYSEFYIPEGQTPKLADSVPILNLRRFCLPHGPLPMRTLTIVAPQLLDLQLDTSPFQFYSVLEILKSATRLNKLSLALDESLGHHLPAQSITAFTAIPSLRTLALNLEDELTWIRLVPILGTLYPQVENVSFTFSLTRDITYVVLSDFLSHLRNLRFLSLDVLYVDLLLKDPHSIELMALEELEVSHPGVLRWLRAPQLLALKLSWIQKYEGVGLDYATVRNLYVKGRVGFIGPLAFTAASLPSLTSLTVHDLRINRPIASSFRSLTIITIINTTDFAPSTATSLCFSILYHPEELPSLRSIRFIGGAPEWDVLFAMLERRNFLSNPRVSRIRSVVLPNIPYILRSTLAALLRGIYATRNWREDVSFTGLIKTLLDRQIPECRTCVGNMLGRCDQPIVSGILMFKRDKLDRLVYSTLHDSIPANLNPAILEWVDRRERDLQALGRLSMTAIRRPICPKQARSVPVEITEHDF